MTKAASESEILRLSESLDVDKKLVMSCESLVDEIKRKIKLQKPPIDEKLKAIEFPSPATLALFSLKVYENLEKAEIADGWELLTTAVNKEISNGYYGAAFWHPEQLRVVVAHRGTDNLGSFVADLMGIVGNNCGGQMESACTFAEQVTQAFRTVEMENEDVHFELFFTGHSLGAWLAHVTAFSNEFLKVDNDTFVKREPTDPEPYHSHTVCFDSPGCLPMLLKLQSKFDCEDRQLSELSVETFLSAPNQINICNEHFGKVYRIFIDTTKMSLLDRNLGYTLAMHSMDNIMKVFQSEKVLMIEEVIEWPTREGLTNMTELEKFLKFADHRNRYHIRDKYRNRLVKTSIRYKTRKVDENSFPINIFTKREQRFLECIRWVRQLPEFESFLVLIEQVKSSEPIENFLLFEIVDGTIRFKHPERLKLFIPRIKMLLKRYPNLAETVQAYLSDRTIRGRAMAFETSLCLKKMDDRLDFNASTIDWAEILENQITQVKLKMGNVRSGLSMVYKTFAKSEHSKKFTSVYVFNMRRFLIVNELVDFEGLLSESDERALLILYIEEDNENIGETKQFSLVSFFKALEQHQHLKVVIIGKTNDQIIEVIRKQALEKFEGRFFEVEISFSWDDLTAKSRSKLLNRSVNFQGRDEVLSNLISADVRLDDEVLLQLCDNENLEINADPLAFCDFSAFAADHDKKELNTNIILESLENSDDIFIISGLYDDQREAVLESLAIVMKVQDPTQRRLIDTNLVISDESIDETIGKLQVISLAGTAKCLEEFEAKCREFMLKNVSRSIHWIKIVDRKISWRKSFSLGSFIDRRLKNATAGIGELKEKFVAIVGPSGEGKSTFLTKFAQDKLKDSWVIYINLSNLPLQKIEVFSYESLASIMTKVAGYDEENHLQNFVLLHKFSNSSGFPIQFCFDGFEEIENERDRARAIKLLKFIKDETKCSMTVTAKDSALDELGPFVCTLEKNTKADKAALLRNYWRSRFALIWGSKKCDEIFDDQSKSKFNSFVDILLGPLETLMEEKAESSIGIPQQLRLLAEGFQEDFDDFVHMNSIKRKIWESLKLKTIYEYYITTKYDFYVSASVFEQKSRNWLESLKNSSSDTEFFSADFALLQLTKSQTSSKVLSLLAGHLLTDKRYKNVRAYLDKRNDFLLTKAALEINDEIIEKILGQPMMTACREGREKILTFLIDVLKKKEGLTNVVLGIDESKKTALNYSVENGNDVCFKILVDFLEKHGDGEAFSKNLLNIGREALVSLALESDGEEFSEWLQGFLAKHIR